MEQTNLISVQAFCAHYQVPVSFINRLEELELLEIIVVQEAFFIPTSKIKEVEKMMRLHYDLEINLEGIDAIHHLLQQLETLQAQVQTLKNKLDFYKQLF